MYFSFGSKLFYTTFCIQTKEIIHKNELIVENYDIDNVYCTDIDVKYHN
jgi:hypothetical protein